MKKIIIIFVLISLIGCELGEKLDIQDMGKSGGYFLECYCIPGELFNLTATMLSPISEPQLLDYSLEFDIHIQGDEKIKLYQSLYVHPDKNFIYNYASPLVVEHPQRGYYELFAITPTGEEVYAKTEIPDPVVIDTAWIEKKKIYYSFQLSGSYMFNYYLTTVFFTNVEEDVKRMLEFNDFSYDTGNRKITLSIDQPAGFDNIRDIQVVLKRLTKENYKYQLAIKELGNTNEDNITSPVMLPGNLTNALGIFTSYTEDTYFIK